MHRLIIEAPYGVEYLAWARLEDANGCQLSRGPAVLKARPGFHDVQEGRYTFRELVSFPRQPAVREEFGAQGLIFQWCPRHEHERLYDASAHAPLLVHGGALQDGGRIKGACGAVRLEQSVLDALVDLMHERASVAGGLTQWTLELQVRIEKSAASGQGWARPSARERVCADQAGFESATVLPQSHDHEVSSAAVAWLAYLDQGQRADSGSEHVEAAFLSGQGGDFGGGGASGSWGDGVASDTGGQAQVGGALQEALFHVSPLPGVDAKGRVVDVQDEESFQVGALAPQTTSFSMDKESPVQAGEQAQTELNTSY
jgi:hypothetical protein